MGSSRDKTRPKVEEEMNPDNHLANALVICSSNETRIWHTYVELLTPVRHVELAAHTCKYIYTFYMDSCDHHLYLSREHDLLPTRKYMSSTSSRSCEPLFESSALVGFHISYLYLFRRADTGPFRSSRLPHASTIFTCKPCVPNYNITVQFRVPSYIVPSSITWRIKNLQASFEDSFHTWYVHTSDTSRPNPHPRKLFQ